jgi:hypothetical protein
MDCTDDTDKFRAIRAIRNRFSPPIRAIRAIRGQFLLPIRGHFSLLTAGNRIKSSIKMQAVPTWTVGVV